MIVVINLSEGKYTASGKTKNNTVISVSEKEIHTVKDSFTRLYESMVIRNNLEKEKIRFRSNIE